MTDRLARSSEAPGRRLAVIDMGSNTFRLVVFRYRPGGSFRLVDEIRDAVRLSAGIDGGRLRPEALGRAERAARLYAAFCEATGIDDVDAVTTSAVRDAANRDEALTALSAGGRLPVRIASAEEEAWYGYLGAVNSTTLGDGCVLDIGGGSMQVSEVAGRRLERSMSRPLGAVRMTEAYLSDPKPGRPALKALRKHVERTLAEVPWLSRGAGRLVGVGGTIRTLAAMAQKAERYPLDELHGYSLAREAIGELIEEMAGRTAAERALIPGLKPDRADITLAGAMSVATAMDVLGADCVEICAQGLREGVFYERYLAPQEPPLIPDVRRAAVLNLAEGYDWDRPHAEHVARLSLLLYDELSRLGLQPGDRRERELLWAAATLHDVGTLVDYNDHHKHGYYLVLNAGLPGFTHRELAMVALLVRGHRKSMPEPRELSPVLLDDDPGRLARLATCLRIAEQLERGRAQGVRGLRLEAPDGAARVVVDAEGDPGVALWSAAQESAVFRAVFDRRLELVSETA